MPVAQVGVPGSLLGTGVQLGISASPTLTGISPSSVLVNSLFTLTVTGSGFQSNSVITWGGTPLPTTFVSSTQLTATVSASQTATVGTYAVAVTTPGLTTTSSQNFTVNNPTPTLSSLSPNTTTVGNRTVPLTVNGSGFVSGATVLWNGTTITTTFMSSIQLTASIPGTDLLSAGAATVTAINPGSTASNGLTFTITGAPPIVPVLTSLSPGSVILGSAQFTLTVNGSQLVSGAVVTWTFLGVATTLTTTFVSAAQVTAIVPASLITVQGVATITAANPGSTVSGGLTFLVNAPAVATLRVTIGGVDVSNYVDVRSMNITQVLTRRGDTATFNIHDYTLGMSFQLLATVVIVDSVGNTMFSGPLTTLERDPVSPTETLFVMGAQDWTYYLSKTLVNKKYTDMTVDAIVKDLLASFPPGVAITTNNVQANLPLLAYISFPHVRLSDAFDKLVRFSSSLSTLMWDIDPYKDLHFFDANHVPEADVQLVDTPPVAGQAGYARDTFKYIEDGSQLANQITFRGATYLSNPPHQQTWVGNGEQASFPLDYVPDTNENAGGSLPGVTVAGITQSVALDVGTGFGSNQVLVTVGINNMAVLQFAVPPAAGAVITAAYVFDLPVIVRTKDNISVTSFGIWEEYITDDTVATTQSAVQRAGAMLSQFSRPLATAQVDVALNYVGALAAGQQLLLVCQQLNVNRQMIVTDCNIVGRAGSKYQYKLKLAAFD